MNRSELAGLIAHNPPFGPPSPIASQVRELSTTSSPISPRARFQSSVRNLQQEPSSPPSDRNRHRRQHTELELVSSLRVTHKRARSAQPAPRNTPDFYTVEREAWASASPELHTPDETEHQVRQCRTHQQARTVLRSFEPLQTIIDVDERPKTSRGHQQFGAPHDNIEHEGAKARSESELEDGTDDEIAEFAAIAVQPGRMSKFIEGSMNQRCSGMASSWMAERQTDSDKPLPPTPAGKRVTFSCTPVCEAVDKPTGQEAGIAKRKERKGLRKSISHFNLQALSGKMRFFVGGSNNDTHSDVSDKQKRQKNDLETEPLNDRKRKAEEAYAAQFGLKKQRFSQSLIPPAPSPNVGESQNTSYLPHNSSKPSTAPATRLPRKQSRRDLERENAELRARLAEQQQHEQQQQQEYDPAAKQDNSAEQEPAVSLSPAKTRRRRSASDAPSVPKLPAGEALQVLENNSLQRKSRLPTNGGKRNSSWGGTETNQAETAGAESQWEWPEDVF